jgi:hypothetical protein
MWRAACGAVTSFCTAGTTTNGCVPSMSASGAPIAGAASGFTIDVASVEGGRLGLILYGLDNTGFTPLPWGSGSSYLCIKSPTQRTTSLSSGGTAGACDGSLALDWLAYVASDPSVLGAPFVGGETVYAQAWFRDPPAAKSTNLSDALRFTVCP